MAYNRLTIESIKKTFSLKISGGLSIFKNTVPIEQQEYFIDSLPGALGILLEMASGR